MGGHKRKQNFKTKLKFMRKMSIKEKNQANGALFFSFIFLYISSEKKYIIPINNPLSRMCILIFFFFFYLAFYIPDIWRTAKSFFRKFLLFVTQEVCDQGQNNFTGHAKRKLL